MDTAEQLVEKNIRLFTVPGGQIWKQFLAHSQIAAYRKLSDTMVIAESWSEYYNYSRDGVIGEGTHGMMTFTVSGAYLKLGKWYRSKEKVSGTNPYGGYITNKKWDLNEETNSFMSQIDTFFHFSLILDHMN